jgi:hypothetical protein
MVIVVYSSGLALSGMGNNPLVSNQPDRKGIRLGSDEGLAVECVDSLGNLHGRRTSLLGRAE